jgi:hypothetical protein
MTHAHLRPCPTCARHVRVTEAGCPFCGATLADSFRASPRPQAPAARLTRAALFALGTGTLALAPACSSSSSTPAYGVPPVEYDGSSGGGRVTTDAGPVDAGPVDAGPLDASTTGSDAPVAEPAYGGPPLDASEDHVTVSPLYGVAAH